MLSSLASISDKTFIVGYVLPLLLFLFAGGLLFIDVPLVHAFLLTIATEESFEKLTYLIIALWVLALLMQLVNHIQLQMLEGYRWPVSRLGFLKRSQVARFDLVNIPFQAVNDEWKAAIQKGVGFPPDREAAWNSLRTKLVTNFPTRKELVLPTRFGNAIRAFELYSAEVYGADSIPLWLNLATVVPKDFQSALDDARAQVNCLVNVVFFSWAIAITAACRFVATFAPVEALSNQPHWIEVPVLFGNVSWIFGVAAVGAALVGWGAYALAIEQVFAWGALVKAAFDCYLPALAKSLGYSLPKTGTEQKEFWIAVSRRAIQHRPLVPEKWPPAVGGDQTQ